MTENQRLALVELMKLKPLWRFDKPVSHYDDRCDKALDAARLVTDMLQELRGDTDPNAALSSMLLDKKEWERTKELLAFFAPDTVLEDSVDEIKQYE